MWRESEDGTGVEFGFLQQRKAGDGFIEWKKTPSNEEISVYKEWQVLLSEIWTRQESDPSLVIILHSSRLRFSAMLGFFLFQETRTLKNHECLCVSDTYC